MFRSLALAGTAALALAGCATGGSLPPTEVVRYHLNDEVARGTVTIQPVTAGPASLEFQAWAAAVQDQLARVGYAPAPPGATADYVAIVDDHHQVSVGPPTRSPVSVGLGAGGYSGGYHGGVGLGGGVSFPIGHGSQRAVVLADLSVTLKRRADQNAVWEGHARTVVDARGPFAQPDALAHKLAAAIFTSFPGQSGRTIEVR